MQKSELLPPRQMSRSLPFIVVMPVQGLLISCPLLRQDPELLIAAVTSVLVNAHPMLVNNVQLCCQVRP